MHMGKPLRQQKPQDLLKNLDFAQGHQGRGIERCTPIHLRRTLEEMTTRSMEMKIRRGEGSPGGQGAPVRAGGGSGDVGRWFGSGGECGDDLKGSHPDP